MTPRSSRREEAPSKPPHENPKIRGGQRWEGKAAPPAPGARLCAQHQPQQVTWPRDVRFQLAHWRDGARRSRRFDTQPTEAQRMPGPLVVRVLKRRERRAPTSAGLAAAAGLRHSRAPSAGAGHVREHTAFHLCPPQIFGFLLLLYLAGFSSAAEPPVLTTHGFTMGSTWSAKYRPAANTPPPRAVEQALQARLDDLEKQMSTWRAASVLSHFNASPETNWFPVPRDTAVVVREALAVSRLTGVRST